MAKNTFERPPKKQPGGRRRGGQSQFSASLDRFTQWLVGEDNSWASNNFWRIVWVSLLIGVYIYCNLRAESLVRRLQSARLLLDEKRSQATVLRADFDKSGRQSEIMKRVSELGLTSGVTPPHHIIIDRGEP